MATPKLEKENLLRNYQLVHLDASAKCFKFLADEKELAVMHANGEVADGDIIIKLSEGNMRVAKQNNHIEIR